MQLIGGQTPRFKPVSSADTCQVRHRFFSRIQLGTAAAPATPTGRLPPLERTDKFPVKIPDRCGSHEHNHQNINDTVHAYLLKAVKNLYRASKWIMLTVMIPYSPVKATTAMSNIPGQGQPIVLATLVLRNFDMPGFKDLVNGGPYHHGLIAPTLDMKYPISVIHQPPSPNGLKMANLPFTLRAGKRKPAIFRALVKRVSTPNPLHWCRR